MSLYCVTVRATLLAMRSRRFFFVSSSSSFFSSNTASMPNWRRMFRSVTAASEKLRIADKTANPGRPSRTSIAVASGPSAARRRHGRFCTSGRRSKASTPTTLFLRNSTSISKESRLAYATRTTTTSLSVGSFLVLCLIAAPGAATNDVVSSRTCTSLGTNGTQPASSGARTQACSSALGSMRDRSRATNSPRSQLSPSRAATCWNSSSCEQKP